MKVLINDMFVKCTYDLENFIDRNGKEIDKNSIQDIMLSFEEFKNLFNIGAVKFEKKDKIEENDNEKIIFYKKESKKKNK